MTNSAKNTSGAEMTNAFHSFSLTGSRVFKAERPKSKVISRQTMWAYWVSATMCHSLSPGLVMGQPVLTYPSDIIGRGIQRHVDLEGLVVVEQQEHGGDRLLVER